MEYASYILCKVIASERCSTTYYLRFRWMQNIFWTFKKQQSAKKFADNYLQEAMHFYANIVLNPNNHNCFKVSDKIMMIKARKHLVFFTFILFPCTSLPSHYQPSQGNKTQKTSQHPNQPTWWLLLLSYISWIFIYMPNSVLKDIKRIT